MPPPAQAPGPTRAWAPGRLGSLGTRSVLVPELQSPVIHAYPRRAGRDIAHAACGRFAGLSRSEARDSRLASHARGRWFETSRAHPLNLLQTDSFRASTVTGSG